MCIPVAALASNASAIMALGEWNLPEGSSAWGFSTYITIENAEAQQNTVIVTYNLNTGPVVFGEVTLPPLSQTTLSPMATIGNKDFSTYIRTKNMRAGGGFDIACDRTMAWQGPGALAPEAHSSIAYCTPYYEVSPPPATNTWYLPDGSSKWGFETWLLIQNTSATDQVAAITYMIEGSLPITVNKTIPASSRQSFSMKDSIGPQDASIMVQGPHLYAERSMYRYDRREGCDSIGTDTPANDYFLAEGSTAWGFSTFVLVQNPGLTPANVTLTYMTNSGPVPQAPFQMPAQSRKTIKVSDYLPNKDFSTQVHADQPIIAERSMFWNMGYGEACHVSIGVPRAYTMMFMPDGQTTSNCETFTLVQNPNPTAVDVTVQYLDADGQGTQTVNANIPAQTRMTFNMAGSGVPSRASIMVTCSQGIIAERSMYWNNRNAGAETVAATQMEIR